MDITILDTNFQIIGILDIYSTLIWTDRFYTPGDFELTMILDESILPLLQKNNYIQCPASDRTMIIEEISIKTDVETGSTLLISGRSLESILSRRIVWGQKTLNGNFQTEMQTLLTETFINPTNADRKIDNFIFESSIHPVIVGATVDAQYNGETVLDITQRNSEDLKIGYRILTKKASPNLVSYNIDFWEPGGYEYDEHVRPKLHMRSKKLIPIEPSTRYCSNVNSDIGIGLHIRLYDSELNYISNIDGTNIEAQIFETPDNASYMGPVLAKQTSTGWMTGEELQIEFINNDLKPFIGKAIGNHIQTASEINSTFFLFDFYIGVDRSYDQTNVAFVIFSPKFDNLLTSSYKESIASYKNVMLVGGEGEGSARVYATVGVGVGLNRREQFINASDISSDVGDHKILTPAEYQLVLQQRGTEELSSKSYADLQLFDGTIETSNTYKYGIDFYIGDIVQFQNEYGHEGRVRVVELIISIDETGTEIYPTFSTEI